VVLLDVLPCVVQQADDVMVVERIEREASRSAHTNETRAAEEPKLVRHR
jgi:hypothetical protein